MACDGCRSTNPSDRPSLASRRWRIGRVGLAQSHPGAEAVIDDLAARKCAAAIGVPVRGTLGIVLAAKRRNLIPLARPLVERLLQSGMYLSDSLMNGALALVGE